jgi:hypothetical protein
MRTPAKSMLRLSPVRTTANVLLILTLALPLAGCGGDGSSPPAEGGADAASTAKSPSSNGATTTVVEAPCGPGDFLPILKRAFDDEASKLQVVRARVERCRGRYAQVFAVPDMSVCQPEVGYCYETEQVFLGWQDNEWRILTSGTGITCGAGNETIPLVIRICRGLGYPDLATSAFQMPSRNIGCALAGGILRCDLLSGLRPEPGAACELDWVGVILPRDSAAEPLCAGDTVYDRAAPTLAYGWTWRRAGFACESRESGLNCTNRAGGEFSLAREGWTAS